ncbi:helix-turn-helix transcriptional regulator [Thioclava sp. F1Mire-8]|uniref:helix-turn-helix transcriptional regulator n=1 Tax=Thioclava sp. F1Mire-8 TaxID=1973006 RepID=UPI000B53F44F|nr:helix-turn-helix transcriptional regulator [Thioclava sp. F1Mire-8]
MINALFAAASEAGKAGWVRFLERLCSVAHAEGAAVQILAPEGEGAGWQVGRIALPDAARLHPMRLDRVYSQIDLPGEVAWPEPLRALKVAAGGAGRVVLMIARSNRDFRAAEALALSTLAPHLGQAVMIREALGGERARAARDAEATAALGAGWLVLTPAGTVLEFDPRVAAEFDAGGWLRLRIGARPEFADPDAALRFRQSLAKLGEGGAVVRPIPLGPEAQGVLRLAPGRWRGSPALIGHLRAMPLAEALPVARVAGALDLNRSEARLAALLCDGASLREAAERLGWTLETARSTSKQIYARAGVSGQTGLLRKMFGSALWLG